jgi:hypothetical protein
VVWQVRRRWEFDGSDVITPQQYATAAEAYDAAMDDLQVRIKTMLTNDPTMNGFKVKGIRDNVGVKGFSLRLQNVSDKDLRYDITEV